MKLIRYRDVDYETAKRDFAGYFQSRGEAYPSDASEDLELDYDLICRTTYELRRMGRLEIV